MLMMMVMNEALRESIFLFSDITFQDAKYPVRIVPPPVAVQSYLNKP